LKTWYLTGWEGSKKKSLEALGGPLQARKRENRIKGTLLLDYSQTSLLCQTIVQGARLDVRKPGALDVGSHVCLFEDVNDGWESKPARLALADQWVEFISGLADWKNFWTLTFEDDKASDVAKSLFQWLVRATNTNLLGKKYINKVGHSYFSYAVGMEKQTRDVIHFHVLADQPINYGLIHNLWGKRCGFAWIDGDLRDKAKVTEYVCKYVLKGGEVDQFKRTREFWPPTGSLSWWKV
jgi:hypothetical protein